MRKKKEKWENGMERSKQRTSYIDPVIKNYESLYKNPHNFSSRTMFALSTVFPSSGGVSLLILERDKILEINTSDKDILFSLVSLRFEAG